MHIVDDPIDPPEGWPETIPDGQFHLSILLSGDTQYECVKRFVAALPALFAAHLPAGLKVGLCYIDDDAEPETPITDAPVICTVPDPHFHQEQEYIDNE